MNNCCSNQNTFEHTVLNLDSHLNQYSLSKKMHRIIVFFISFMLFPPSSAPPANLYLTDITNEHHQKHHCLQIPMSLSQTDKIHETHAFCLSQPSSTWIIQPNHIDQRFTFQQLKQQNITIEQLRLWSASLDLMDRYQQYLDNPSSIDPSSQFYNCSSPRFGPHCQYSFEHPKADQLSLTQLMNSFFANLYESSELTCYTHLHCVRVMSPEVCLDWSDVCDGYVDCLNDDIDEKDCWKLDINECGPDEYRCDNGQCIPKMFAQDGKKEYECLDRSDETQQHCQVHMYIYPSSEVFAEDIVDTRHRRAKSHRLSSSCTMNRNIQLKINLTLSIPQSVSHYCWQNILQLINDRKSKHRYNDTITQSCPPIIMSPTFPVFFGHVFLALSRDSIIQKDSNAVTEYVCYNPHLCGGFHSNQTVQINANMTCHYTQNFRTKPFSPVAGPTRPDLMENVHRDFSQCNTILFQKPDIYESRYMYQCRNSSKFISIRRICDGIIDCDHKEDEDCPIVDGTCQAVKPVALYPCPRQQRCISINMVNDGHCDCDGEDLLCDDESIAQVDATTRISFQTICDGFTELIPIEIDGQNETDETHCQYWQCNNTYTRCDGYWNCFNGADEVDCPVPPSSPLVHWQCPQRSHRCASLNAVQATCLPIEKANDGHADCLGGTDEPQLCRSKTHQFTWVTFFCKNHTHPQCIPLYLICSSIGKCVENIHKPLCKNTPNHLLSNLSSLSLSNNEQFNAFLLQEFFSDLPTEDLKPRTIHFYLERNTSTHTAVEEQNTLTFSHRYRCHRGLPLLVWIDHQNNSAQKTCLCPPQYYGSRCQYQNQRVSLTLRLQTFSDSRRLLLSILITLIDHTDQRLVHSFHQFTYLHTHHCQNKFNFYLLYASTPKAINTTYSVHIDIYETISTIYRGSILVPIRFLFLPVYRMPLHLQIPSMSHLVETCNNLRCQHGQCIRYFRSDHPIHTSFCRCDPGWTGQLCDVSYHCQCASSSQCLGQSANNQSICLCPADRWGSSCRFRNRVCQSGDVQHCQNGGQCLSINDEPVCLCSRGYSGKRCEKVDSIIHLSFDSDMDLPAFVLVHFIEVIDRAAPDSGSTFKNIPFDRRSITIHWSQPFHIIFVEFVPQIYHLALLQTRFNGSSTFVTKVIPSHRCPHFSEFFNASIVDAHLLIRIKYYHRVCQLQPSLSCFYDRDHFCVCITEDDRRYSNCFEYNPTLQYDCSGTNVCMQGARCLQDRATCPQTSVCQCPSCYYGSRCQFTSHLFSLSLDSIMGSQIVPHVSTVKQPALILISIGIVMVMSVIGYVNGILALITFSSAKTRQVGCGYYLLATSITTLFTVTIFLLKFWILVLSQMNAMRDRSFLSGQCLLLDFLLRFGLATDRWLNACVAIERSISTLQGVTFDRNRSRRMAKYIIPVLVLVIVLTYLHDPIHRHLYDEEDVDGELTRIWCIANYSNAWQIYNRSIEIFHYSATVMINVASALIISIMTARLRTSDDNRKDSHGTLLKQFQLHQHLIITPILLAALAVPSVVIQFISGCSKSGNDARLLLFGYLCLFLPTWFCFVIFVVPSALYKTEFRSALLKAKRKINLKLLRRWD